MSSHDDLVHEPTWSKSFRDDNTKSMYWVPNIDDKITPDVRKVLEVYSHIPPDEVRQHVYDIRDKAWAIRSYPRTGIGLWLASILTHSPAYPTIIKRLKGGDSLLDIGSYLGTDLRRLVFDGGPSDKFHAMDIVSHWELGYEMYRDRSGFAADFIEADILKPSDELLKLHGEIDIVILNQLLHQWDVPTQRMALNKIVSLTRPGALIVGFNIGSIDPIASQKDMSDRFTEIGVEPSSKLSRDAAAQFWHTTETFKAMWIEVGKETGTSWDVDAELVSREAVGWNPKDTEYLGPSSRVLQFVVTRKD